MRPEHAYPPIDVGAVSNVGVLHPSALVGVDLVEIAQVALSIERFGQRYLQRVFTSGELAHCTADGRDSAPHLAARFAAKEAVLKVLRAADEAVDWRSIEVVRHADGHCSLLLHDRIRALARRRGVRTLRLSLSHDGGYAIAMVVGEASPPPEHTRFRIARKGPRRMQRR